MEESKYLKCSEEQFEDFISKTTDGGKPYIKCRCDRARTLNQDEETALSKFYRRTNCPIVGELSNKDILLDMYYKLIREIPPLYREEESGLFKMYKKYDCQHAKEEIFLSSQRFVISVAKKFLTENLDLFDLINEGNIGLIEAIEKYNVNTECRFTTYSVWYIQRAIKSFVESKFKMIRK